MPRHSTHGRGLKIFLVVLAVLAGIIVVCEILGWPFLRKPVENLASRQLNREVRIEEPFELHLLGGISLSVGGLWIAAPKMFDAPYLLDAENITLKLRYSDLIGWDSATEPFTIKMLNVKQMDAYLLRNKQGATWQFKEEQPDEKPTPFPVIDTLVVQQGTAVVKDTITDADLEASFRTREGTNEAKAVSVVEAEGTFRDHPIKGQVITPGFLEAAQQGKDQPIPLDAWVNYGGVRVEFLGNIANISAAKEIRGNFTIKGPSLGIVGDLFNITLPTTTEFIIKGDLVREEELIKVDIENARVGSSDLSGQFSFDTSGEKIFMKGYLNSSNFVLADLAPTFGTRAEDGSEIERPEGQVFPDRQLNLPALNKFNAEISLDFQRVHLGRFFEEPISPFKAYLDLNSGKLSLAKIDARTAEGSLAGTIAVDANALGESGKQDPDDQSRPKAQWALDLDWKNIKLGRWIKGREQTEPGEPRAYVTGLLNGNVDLKGRGNSTSELLGSLNGNISTYINQGQISHLLIEALGLDVAQALGLLIKSDELLPMHCAVVDLQSQQGIVKTQVALIDTPVTLVLMDGRIDLQQEQLDLRFVAKPENVSLFTARTPILVDGTLANPEVHPKVAPIAARVLGSIALAFVNPLAAIIPFLDPGTGDHAPCDEVLREFKTRNAKAGAAKSASGNAGGRGADKPAAMQRSAPAEAAPSAAEPGQAAPGSAAPPTDAPIGNPPYGTRGIPGHGAD